MTKYLNPSFSVHVGGKAYSDGWDRIFGKKKRYVAYRFKDDHKYYLSERDKFVADIGEAILFDSKNEADDYINTALSPFSFPVLVEEL